MSKKKTNKTNKLKWPAQLVLFLLSYIPLFFLIILKQVSGNSNYLHFGEFSSESINLLFSKFGISIVLIIISILGFLGYLITFKNIKDVATNGLPYLVTDVKNKNSEAIGYIATYIVPFLYKSFDGWYECLSLLFLMLIIYRIYINSNLLLINPLLSIKYAIYEIEYNDNDKSKNGLVITENKNLQENSTIKLYPIGFKLFYSINEEK